MSRFGVLSYKGAGHINSLTALSRQLVAGDIALPSFRNREWKRAFARTAWNSLRSAARVLTYPTIRTVPRPALRLYATASNEPRMTSKDILRKPPRLSLEPVSTHSSSTKLQFLARR